MLFFLIVLFYCHHQPLLATAEFEINQKVNYYFDQQGNASVKHQYQITNNLSQIFLTKYTITLPSTDIKNISAHDQTGNIQTTHSLQGDQTKINLNFNRPKIGKNQTTTFTLSYQQPNLAKMKGNTWEINIPRLTKDNPQDTINLRLDLPSDFGNLSFSSLGQPQSQLTNQQQLQLKFLDSQINNRPILLIFGDYQIFDLNLSYQLDNQKPHPINSYIAIPPNTNRQQITIENLSPPPENITTDPDGNWLAWYQVPPTNQIEINFQGQARVTKGQSLSTTINPQPYLQSSNFWPVDHPSVKTIVTNLSSAESIYQYVINHLDYNYQLIPNASRQGAIRAIEAPQNSLCTEFTDLFVTLARAKNIPAREIEGYAITNNPKIKPINTTTDILHAWPQYYHSSHQTWIDIDPTWEKTTHGIDYFNELDLNHITFVIHGTDSQLPPPPNKSVFVAYADHQIPYSHRPPEIQLIKYNLFQSPTIRLKNTNNHALSHLTIDLSSPSFSTTTDLIPPYGYLDFTIPPAFFSQSLNFNILSTENGSQQLSITNNYHYLHLATLIGSLIIILSASGIILAVSKSHQR